MKLLKFLLLSTFLLFATASMASAAPFKFNVNGSGPGTATSVSDAFNVDGFASIFNSFTGPGTGTFDEVAVFVVNGIDTIPPAFGNRQLTAVFEASGTVTSTDFTFTSGTLRMYVDDITTGTAYGNTADLGLPSPFFGANDGTEIAEWNLVGGGGALDDNFIPLSNGQITAIFEATNIAAGYFFDANDNDLSAWTTSTASPLLTLGLATVNASLVGVNNDPNGVPNQGFAEETDELAGFTVPTDGSGDYVNDLDATNFDQVFQIANDGQWRISVVPEPTTMLLFGVGLIGLAGIGRRRS